MRRGADILEFVISGLTRTKGNRVKKAISRKCPIEAYFIADILKDVSPMLATIFLETQDLKLTLRIYHSYRGNTVNILNHGSGETLMQKINARIEEIGKDKLSEASLKIIQDRVGVVDFQQGVLIKNNDFTKVIEMSMPVFVQARKDYIEELKVRAEKGEISSLDVLNHISKEEDTAIALAANLVKSYSAQYLSDVYPDA